MKTRIKRILALALSVVMMFSIMPQITLFANAESSYVVYVDSTNGNDSNDGTTKETAFKTMDQAITAIEGASNTSGLINIVGTYTNSVNPNTNLMNTVSKPITIQGADGTNSILKLSQRIRIGDNFTFDNLTIEGNNYYISAIRNHLTMGSGVRVVGNLQLVSGDHSAYNETASAVREQMTISGGNFSNVWIGNLGAHKQGNRSHVSYGVDYVQNGGSVKNLQLGTGAVNSDYAGANKYFGTLNFTINGGSIGTSSEDGILLKDDQVVTNNQTDRNKTNFNNNAVQIIFNNGTRESVSAIPTASDIEKFSGKPYILECEAKSGSYLTITETAGTYTVYGDLPAVATDKTDGSKVYTSENGQLVVPTGTYTVTWFDESEIGEWEVTSDDVEGTNVVPTVQSDKYNVTTPANKLAVALDNQNGFAYVAQDKFVDDKAPETNYVSTKYADWNCFDNNGTYLTNTYKKLTDDKELTVVYFGGSLTAGFGCGQTGDPNDDSVPTHDANSWRALAGQWLTTNFPEATINNINAAIGESGTYLGTYRVQTDIISQEPDLLFIEYAINDNYFGSSESEAALMFETIVREVKQALPNCDIITVLTTDKAKIGTTFAGDLFNTAKGHNVIAEAYRLPVVNLGLGLAKGIADVEGNDNWWTDSNIWKKYFYDDVHPYSTGHEQYYLCMEEFLNNNLKNTNFEGVETSRSNLPTVQSEHLLDGNRKNIFGADMKKYFVSGSNTSYNDGIFRAGTSATQRKGYYQVSANGSITYKFSGTEFAIWSDLLGDFSYVIDNGESQTVESSTHQPTQVVKQLIPGDHTITIKPNKDMKIAAVFSRDESEQTVKGATYSYPDFKGMTLTLPAGNYKVYYATTIGDLPTPTAPEGQRFAGWKDENSNILKNTDLLVKGMALTATWETVYEVYVDAINGNDGNDGLSRDAAFQTLAKAVTTVENSDKASGVINIVGTYSIANSVLILNNANKPITIQGADGIESILQFNIRTGLGGTTTFDNITITGSKVIACSRNTVTFCSGVNMQSTIEMVTGTYGNETVYTEATWAKLKKEQLTINNGSVGKVWLGQYATKNGAALAHASHGVDYIQNGGSIGELNLGTGATNATYNVGNVYRGAINITINGGAIGNDNSGGILLKDSTYVTSRTRFNNNAVQILFNNGTKANVHSVPTASEIAEWGGVPYILNCEANEGSYLVTTSKAGTYVVMGDVQAIATDTEDKTKVYYSENGQLVVPTGTYDVTWKVDESPLLVYVDQTYGDDSNNGLTRAKAFKTLNAAVSAIEAAGKPTGIVNVIGKVTIDNSIQSKNLSAHTKMITIKGVDDDSNIYLNGQTLVTNGPLTISDIKVTVSQGYIGFDSDTHEFILGENVTNATYPYLELMAGPSNKNSDGLKLSMNSGNLYRIVAGVFSNTDNNIDEIKGLNYVHNGGQLSILYLGSNAWEQNGTNFYSTAFTDNVNIVLNGGQLGEISLLKPVEGSVSQTKRDLFFRKAVQILINDEGYMTNALPKIEADGGLWVMNGHGSGYNLEVTETAGVYTVPSGVTAIAYSEDGSRTYVSSEGVLTVSEPGNYTVEYKTTLDYTNSGTVITFYQDTTIASLADFAVKEKEDKLFAGWLDAEGNAVTGTQFSSGTVLTAQYVEFKNSDNGDFFIKGNQIREDSENQEIRTVVQLSNSISETFSSVEYGTVHIVNKLLGVHDLVKDGKYPYNDSTHNATCTVGTALEEAEENVLYTATIGDIQASGLQTDYAIKGYVTYSDLNGISRTVYTEELVISVSDIAEKLLKVDAQDVSVKEIIENGKTSAQKKFVGNNLVTEESVGAALGTNFNNGVIATSDGKVAMTYNQLDNGMVVRDVQIAGNGNSKETTSVVQISDPHFNYYNEEDAAEGNPSTLSTWENRGLNKMWNGIPTQSIFNFANSMEYAEAYADKVVVTGDVLDYISNGTISLMQRYINKPYSDAMVVVGNHDPIRVMGLKTDVPDAGTVTSRYDLIQKSWNNDVYYTSEMVSEDVMIIQLDNSQNKFWNSQIEKLTNDLAEARENNYTVLLFMHEPISTGDSADTAVPALIATDDASLNFYNGSVIKSSANNDTATVINLITSYGDVVKGIFAGHTHSDYYSEVHAKDAKGGDTYIPQYVLTANFYGKGHVLKITVGSEETQEMPVEYNTAVLYNEQHSSYDESAEARRQEILNAPDTVVAAEGSKTYYVSHNGDDANDGTSPEEAWRTPSKINEAEFEAGDAVLFERGGVYRGTFTVTSGVSYGAYGSGAKPCIYGSNQNYAKPLLWNGTETANVWRISVPSTADIGNIVFDQGNKCGWKKTTNKLLNDFEFFHDVENELLYLYLSSGNPGVVYDDIEFCINGQIIEGVAETKNVLIENLCLKFVGGHGIVFKTGAENITVQGCDVGYCGGSMLNASVRYGNGVEFVDKCKNIDIKNNWVYQCYDAGITHQSSNAEGCVQEDITISGNLVEYCSYNIEYYVDATTGTIKNTLYENNILRFAGYGFGSVNRIGSDVSRLSNINNYLRKIPCENFVIQNNVFDSSKKYQIAIGSPNDVDGNGPVIEGNIFIQQGQYVALTRTDGTNITELTANDLESLRTALEAIDKQPKSIIYE